MTLEKYIVTSTGIKDNTPYSILSRIVSGVKENGSRYEFVDNKTTQREPEEMPVGTILEYETQRISPTKPTLNINSKSKED